MLTPPEQSVINAFCVATGATHVSFATIGVNWNEIVDIDVWITSTLPAMMAANGANVVQFVGMEESDPRFVAIINGRPSHVRVVRCRADSTATDGYVWEHVHGTTIDVTPLDPSMFTEL